MEVFETSEMMCVHVCVCQALDVNGLGSFECQHFVRITSNLSRVVFEGVDGACRIATS